MTATFVLVLMSSILGADPVVKPVDSAVERERKEAVAVMAPAKARTLRLVEATHQDTAAKLHPQPLLRWSNATAGSVYGEVFLWSSADRPVAVASIYRWYDPYQTGTVEITSLCDSSLEMKEGEKTLWNAAPHGVQFKRVTPAPTPATNKGARLRQMREIVRRFAVKLSDDRSGDLVSRGLRLLDQPIYRYQSDSAGIVDGAVFVFAENTDPEVLVLLEAVKDGDQSYWHYGLARMNGSGLEVQLDETVVQTWDKVNNPAKDPKSTYAYFDFNPQFVKIEEQPPAAP